MCVCNPHPVVLSSQNMLIFEQDINAYNLLIYFQVRQYHPLLVSHCLRIVSTGLMPQSRVL